MVIMFVHPYRKSIFAQTDISGKSRLNMIWGVALSNIDTHDDDDDDDDDDDGDGDGDDNNNNHPL